MTAAVSLQAIDFMGSPPEVAQRLLGMRLRHGSTTGCVIETEAYGPDDAASHSYRGPTPRNLPMFGPPGHAYVYLSYGMHWCLNVVCGPRQFAAAVLLRALLPLRGLEHMRQRRQRPNGAPLSVYRLSRGPGCLTQALGINGSHNKQRLYGSDDPTALQLLPRLDVVEPHHIIATPRIGIRHAQTLLWRFCLIEPPSLQRYISG